MLSIKNYSAIIKWHQNIIFLTVLFLISFLKGNAQCNDVDLQAVSIDPSLTAIGKGQTASIAVVMKNNSECKIPTGEATAQITFSSVYLDLGSPINFKDFCGQWVYLGAVSDKKQHNLFFQNKGGPIQPGGKFCSFHFDIIGKAVASYPVPVTLASSLSGDAKSSDINGNNQSTSTQVHVRSIFTPVAEPPQVIADFTIAASDCDAILKWKTVAEKNVDSFEVEYGKNDLEFVKVGTVTGKHSASGSDYQFTYDQGNGRGYYRLSVIRKDGKHSYSKVIYIDTKCIIKRGFNP